jgi:hypothetical protein
MTMYAKTISGCFTLVAAMLLLAACAEMPRAPADEAAATPAAGYGRAFGRIQYLDEGKELTWSASLFADTLTVFVRSASTGQMHYMNLEGDGSFYWPLPAGEYAILGYQLYRSVSNARSTGRLMTTFSVPQPGQAVYIGELRIETGKSRYRFGVLDRYAGTLQRVEARLADGKFPAAKGLMRLEPQPGSYKRVTGICARSWGLECDSNYQGVRPLEPEGAARGFPVAKDLTPLLAWKPSTRPEVTYDVAIYESLAFNYGAMGSVKGLRGTLVAYAEGLREPRYSAAALEPGKRYEWTVRVRDGDTVSSWSTTSYNFFAVVAWGRGSGQYFGLETPGK